MTCAGLQPPDGAHAAGVALSLTDKDSAGRAEADGAAGKSRAPSWQPGADTCPGGAGRGGGGGRAAEEEEWWRSGEAKLEKCLEMLRRVHGRLGAFTHGQRPPTLPIWGNNEAKPRHGGSSPPRVAPRCWRRGDGHGLCLPRRKALESCRKQVHQRAESSDCSD